MWLISPPQKTNPGGVALVCPQDTCQLGLKASWISGLGRAEDPIWEIGFCAIFGIGPWFLDEWQQRTAAVVTAGSR